MWLVNTNTLSLEFAPDDRKAKYAILSHRWEQEEVLWEDMNPRTQATTQKAGWSKVQKACEQATKDGYQYIWIDTCCIDQKSSAELSEAINSMCRWYENATVCYAYLSDIRADDAANSLPSSVWFTRGWTLQELIAPPRLKFFDLTWKPLGSRERHARDVSGITGIPGELLGDGYYRSLSENYNGRPSWLSRNYSVAQRFSWAARRETTRIEDRSYCLMGLFGVNMPMLYGEGERAFARLQDEIMKQSTDHSIFAWECPSEPAALHDLLARSVDQFANCGHIVASPDDAWRPYHQTNSGLQISFHSRPYALEVYHAALNCAEVRADGQRSPIGIFLGCQWGSTSPYRVGRCRYQGRDRLAYPTDHLPTSLYSYTIPRSSSLVGLSLTKHYGFTISQFHASYEGEVFSLGDGVSAVVRPDTWDADRDILTLRGGTRGTAMCFAVHHKRTPPIVICRLGFTDGFRPWVCLDRDGSSRSQLTKEYNEPITEGRVMGTWGHAKQTGRRVEDVLAENPFSDVAENQVSSEDCYFADRMRGLDVHFASISIKVERCYNRGYLQGCSWDVAIRTRP